MKLSIIIPVLNDAAALSATLASLQELQAAGHEIIVVDGGSHDDSLAVATSLADQAATAAAGRARQMNAGAGMASGDVLWFVHADSRINAANRSSLLSALNEGASWGWFDVELSGHQAGLRWVEKLMNRRARLTNIATGDQALFVRRKLFDAVGGFPVIELMEDVAISRRLKNSATPVVLTPALQTSSRRWESHGILRTIMLMWTLRLAYFLGASPRLLVRLYY